MKLREIEVHEVTAPATPRIVHFFSVDVEEYFQVSAMELYVPRYRWDTMESRVGHGVDLLLEILERRGVTATFFILGWVAERHRDVVETIHRAGHEVASHGWGHERVLSQTMAEFRESVRRSKAVLESITGESVLGYRAPSFSIVPGMEWAFDILLDEGYRYDSSLFPVRRSGYGYPGGCRDVHELERESGRLVEVPPATLRCYGRTLPAGGGAYFRLLPYALIRAALNDYERRGEPATFYIHPWEVDVHQPRIPRLSWPTRLRHYGGLRRTLPGLMRLLNDFQFGPIRASEALSAPARTWA